LPIVSSSRNSECWIMGIKVNSKRILVWNVCLIELELLAYLQFSSRLCCNFGKIHLTFSLVCCLRVLWIFMTRLLFVIVLFVKVCGQGCEKMVWPYFLHQNRLFSVLNSTPNHWFITSTIIDATMPMQWEFHNIIYTCPYHYYFLRVDFIWTNRSHFVWYLFIWAHSGLIPTH
jgi:hypothetical protein